MCHLLLTRLSFSIHPLRSSSFVFISFNHLCNMRLFLFALRKLVTSNNGYTFGLFIRSAHGGIARNGRCRLVAGNCPLTFTIPVFTMFFILFFFVSSLCFFFLWERRERCCTVCLEYSHVLLPVAKRVSNIPLLSPFLPFLSPQCTQHPPLYSEAALLCALFV